MSARALLARALAAVAVTGLAVAGPALSAGAATEPPPVVSLAPTGVTVVVGTRPVVTLGDPSAPAPGVHATVPVSGDAHASVGRSDRPDAPVSTPVASAPGAAAPLLGPTASAARLVDADVSLRLCLAAALLGGRADGCASPAPSGPSLADAVARTFLCARVAVLGADGVTACDVDPVGADGPVPPARLGTDAESGACITATVVGAADPSRCDAPAGPSPAPAGIDGATAGLASSTCAVVAVLGGATGCPGPTASEPTGPTAGSGGNGGTVVSTVDTCVALAALSSDIAPACPSTTAAGTPGGGDGDPGTTPVLVTAPAADPGSTVLGAELAGTTGGSGSAVPHGDLAFSGADTLFLTITGLGAIAGGAALRRAGRLGLVR